MLTTPSISISISVLAACCWVAKRSVRAVEIHAVPIRAISTSSATTRIRTEPERESLRPLTARRRLPVNAFNRCRIG